ncbi:glycoside hydrolase family 73 protein [Enterococcus bulliens]
MILLGFVLILGAFVFSLKQLTTPIFEYATHTQSNEPVSREAFIETLVPHAKELQEGYGILPSIILGQAILESDWGQSELASKYNNLFGIKAYGNQKKIKLDTQEFVNEQWITIKGEFRVYDSWEASMDDHTLLFVNGVTWNPQKYEGVLTATNYEAAADALQEAGYATDPTYAQKIKTVIEENALYQYD